MTADVIDLPPPRGRVDDTIRRTIKALAKGKGIKGDDLADLLGISRSAYFDKMGDGHTNALTGGEIATIARRLGVKVERLYDGLGGTFAGDDDTPPDGGESLPRLDSNQKPSDLVSLQVSDLLATAA